MSNRTFESVAKTASQAVKVVPVMLVFLDYASAPIRVHSGIGDLVFEANTYKGIGTFGKVNKIDESTDISAADITLELSGIPSEMISYAFEEAHGRQVKIWIGFMDLDDPLTFLGDPELEFQGLIDSVSVEMNGDTSRVLVGCENPIADWRRARVNRYNNADQQVRYPNDKGLEFVDDAVVEEIKWGPEPDIRTHRGK